MLMNFDLQSYLYLDKTKKHKNKHGQIICQHYELCMHDIKLINYDLQIAYHG